MSHRLHRLTLILLVFAGFCFGIDGNFNGDCRVNFADFAVFAAQWQLTGANITDPNTDINSDGTVDTDDLVLFTDNWLAEDPNNPCEIVPTAGNITVNYTTFADVMITLDGTDDGDLTYFVTAMPDTGDFYDANGITEANHLNPAAVKIESVPFELSGDKVIFYSEVPDITTAAYYCSDGDTNSTSATITIYVDGIPVAANINTSTYEYYRHNIALSGDVFNGRTGKYIITSLPDGASLIDPAPSAGVITSGKLPYGLANNENDVVFVTDTNGVYKFEYRLYDGIYTSLPAEVNVTVAANPKDCINFDGLKNQKGYVEMAHNSLLNMADGRGIMFFIKTRNPDCWLLKKRLPGGAGYEIALEGGMPVLNLFEAGGLKRSYKCQAIASDGLWNGIGLVYKYNAGIGVDLYFETIRYDYDGHVWTGAWEEEFTDVPDGNYINDANLMVSTVIGSIDRIRFYNDYNPAAFDLFNFAGASFEGRNDAGDGAFVSPKTAVVRFMFAESATDEVAGISGQLNDTNAVNWTPLLKDTRGIIESDNNLSREDSGYGINANGEKIEPKEILRRER